MTDVTGDDERVEGTGRYPGLLLGMVLFITSEVMFFGGLFGAYFTIRGGAEVWPPPNIHIELFTPIGLTVVLLTSSLVVHRASAAAREGDRATVVRSLGATIVMGLAFLGGQAFEYSRLTFGLDENAFSTLYFTLTGFHGLHVLGGIVVLSLGLAGTRNRGLDARRQGQIEAAALYWHFVDAIWMLLFVTIYVIR